MMAADECMDVQPRVVLKGGASIVSSKPVFSLDSKYLLLASGFVIKVLSVKSGECVRELSGHQGPITSLQLHPQNRYQVLSCSLDQTIIKWDFTDGALLKKYKCPKVVYNLLSTGLEYPAFLGLTQVTKTEYEVVQFSLAANKKELTFKTLEKRMLRLDQNLSFGCKEEIVACVHGKSFSVHSIKTKHRREHRLDNFAMRTEQGKAIESVACHPAEYCIATGTDVGSIHLWYNFMSSKKVTKTTVHWHALPVRCLNFTTEGSYMLSGGHECVLVKWQHNTHHRDTLPRLGAPIINISCSRDNMHYATSHSDNTLQIINNQFKVTQVVVGLTQAKLDQAQEDQVPAGLLVDPRTDALVLNGRPGHLQFYSLESDKQLFSVDIVCQNYISPENLRRPLVMTEVIKAAFSPDGRWLATGEWRNDGVTTPEQKLKFWIYDEKLQTYRLNTSVEMPHTDRMEQLKFRSVPDEEENRAPCLVSTSRDGKFKIWQVVDDSDIYTTSSCWSCESVGFYREECAGKADFSEDGSLLAIAFGTTLTFWDPDSNALQQTLPLQEKISDVMFGSGTCSHLIAIATKERLVVWNLLTFSCEWILPLKVSFMCMDAFSGLLATFGPDNSLKVFKMSEKQPVYGHAKITEGQIQASIFIPNKRTDEDAQLPWGTHSRLYFLNTDQELHSLTEEPEISGVQGKRVAEKLPETPFSLLLSDQRRRQLKQISDDKQAEGQLGKKGAQYLKEMLDTPAHVLPPVGNLCVSFIEKLMVCKKSSISALKETDDDDDESDSDQSESDSDMEVDDEVLSKTPTKLESKPADSGTTLTQNFESVKPSLFEWIA